MNANDKRLLDRYLNMQEHKSATMCSDSPLVGKSLTSKQTNRNFGDITTEIGKGSFGSIFKTKGDKYIMKNQPKNKDTIIEIAIMHYLDHPNLMLY